MAYLRGGKPRYRRSVLVTSARPVVWRANVVMMRFMRSFLLSLLTLL